MSRKAKTRNQEKRKRDKRGRKAAMKAQYEAWRDQGINKKSGRFQRKQSRKQVLTGKSHPFGKCGNTGCMRCSPVYGEDGPLHWQLEERNILRTRVGLKPIQRFA